MKYGNLTLGQVEALVNKIGGMDRVTDVLCGKIELTTRVVNFITHTFTVLVDETKTVEELVKEGNFDWSNSDITSENFPKPTNGKKSEKEIALFHFNKTMTSDEAIAEMDKVGCRPATIWELLGLGIKQPNLQREFPIIALGCVCVVGGGRRVAYLCRDVDGRNLFLRWFGNAWDDYCRFAGVRK